MQYELKQLDAWQAIELMPIGKYIDSQLLPHKTVSREYIKNVINTAELDIPFNIFDSQYLVKYCNIRNNNVVFLYTPDNTILYTHTTLEHIIRYMSTIFNTECIKPGSIKVGVPIINRFGFRYIIGTLT